MGYGWMERKAIQAVALGYVLAAAVGLWGEVGEGSAWAGAPPERGEARLPRVKGATQLRRELRAAPWPLSAKTLS